MKRIYYLFGLSLLWLAACQTAAPSPTPSAPNTAAVTLRLMTHDSFEISEATLAQFTAETGHQVEIFKAGDTGEMLNKAVLAREAPLADVLFGVDNTFLSRALDNDIFVPYASPALANIPAAFQLDAQNRALPVDFGDVCLNYDKAWFAENGIRPPQALADLTDPTYGGLTVVQNPATSSPGLAFLLATIAAFGEEEYIAYWQRLVANDVLIVSDWSSAYYGEFTAASEAGTRPIVVSYASSPPAEVYFAESELSEAPTAAVVAPQSCFRQIEFVGILQGTPHETAAQQLVDFMLSKTFQEDIPLNMFVYPVNETAVLPPVFAQHSTIPSEPALLDYAQIAANREAWVQAWTDVALR